MSALDRAMRVVRLAGRLVPRWRRDEWTREWSAELTHAGGDTGRRALGSVADALFLRTHAMQLDLLWNDARLAVRQVGRHPGFALLVAMTLAIGLGVNSAVLALVDGILLRPLPYPEPARLVFVWQTLHANNLIDVEATPFDYGIWRGAHSFAAMALVAPDSFTIAGDVEPERVKGARVTATALPMLGMAPQVGRGFVDSEDFDSSAPVVLLSDRLWRRRYAADPTIIGRTIRVDGSTLTVVGLLPAEAELPGPLAGNDEILLPARMSSEERANGISHNYTVIARLAGGVPLARAQAEMSSIAAAIAREHPTTHGALGAHVVSAAEQTTSQIRPALIVLLGGVLLLLLIACANAGTLLVARSAGRRQELAIRSALGAGAGHLLSLALVETVVLSTIGGLAGVAAGDAIVRALLPLFADSLPRAAGVRVDARVALSTMSAALLVGAALGVLAARTSPHSTLGDALKAGGRTGTPNARRTRYALVVAQVALAVVLLATAGLMVRSFERLQRVSPGFVSDHLLTFRLALPTGGYPSAATRAAFVTRLVDRLAVEPGVVSASANSRLPFGSGRGANEIAIDGFVPDARELPIADQREVTPEYFGALRIPVVAGRSFTATDDARAEPVAIVNQSMVRRFWPDGHVLNARVRVVSGPEESGWLRVVGVVSDVRHSGLARPPAAELYRPLAQMPMPDFFVVVRTTGDPDAFVPSARAAVRAVDRNLPVYDIRTMEQRVARSLAEARATAVLLLVMAALAGTLAAVAIYGSIWYSVARRRPEIGIRIALGETRRSIFGRVIAHALAPTAIGIAIGTTIAMTASPLLRGLLFDTRPADPLVYATVVASVILLTLAASIVPARRAMQIDPLQALRAD